jgi:hypothetical protein
MVLSNQLPFLIFVITGSKADSDVTAFESRMASCPGLPLFGLFDFNEFLAQHVARLT